MYNTWKLPRQERETVYEEMDGGRLRYWTYSDGQRVYVDRSWAMDQDARGLVKIVHVK